MPEGTHRASDRDREQIQSSKCKAVCTPAMIAPWLGDNTKAFDGRVVVGLGSSDPNAKRQNT